MLYKQTQTIQVTHIAVDKYSSIKPVKVNENGSTHPKYVTCQCCFVSYHFETFLAIRLLEKRNDLLLSSIKIDFTIWGHITDI